MEKQQELVDVNGESLSPEAVRMLDYLRTRAAELPTAGIRERIRAAAQELESAVSAVKESEARLRPIEGRWNIAEVVDHIAQTQVRAAEELRHLLVGRRPPLPPVYEALRSGAGQWAPWADLVEGLHSANQALIEVLVSAPAAPPSSDAPSVRTILVVLRTLADGGTVPQIWPLDLGWKEYALLQRLHLLDHRTQIKRLRAAIAA